MRCAEIRIFKRSFANNTLTPVIPTKPTETVQELVQYIAVLVSIILDVH